VQRAAVLIGVSRTGGLPALKAVTPGIDRMVAWARAQGFSSITTITDDAGPVTAGQVQLAIGAMVAVGTVEQLIVYFAGHGVNIGRAEYWLLSGAPTWANEAVNVDASERLAQYCGVAHVVLISDCCRTAAAADTAFQSISGAPVFPNEPPGPERRPVDRFYACALGSPALEVRPAGADGYTAVYTATLVEALGGKPDSLLERTDDGGMPVGLVRPWPLQEYLTDEVGRRLVRLTGSFDHTQVPDAVITSGPKAWLSRFERPVRPARPRGPAAPSPAVPTPAAQARAAVRAALAGPDEQPHDYHGRPGYDRDDQDSLPPPPGQARVLARGTSVAAAESLEAGVTERGDEVAVDLRGRASTDLLLRFANGTCALIPALRTSRTVVRFDGRELVGIDYSVGSPGAGSLTWRDGRRRAAGGSLATAVSTAARLGALRLTPRDAERLAEHLLDGPPDPALAVQAAYAFADLRREDLAEDVAEEYAQRLGVDLFDLVLLTGRRHLRRPLRPAVPLLARGWALLGTADIAMPDEAAGLRRHLVPSVWTLFDDAAVPEARDVLLAAGGGR
jgi:hypothetical protein